MPVACPVCLAEELLPYSTESWNFDGINYHLAICNCCKSAYTAPLPTDEVLANLYKTSFDYRWYKDHYEAKLKDCNIRLQEYSYLLGRKVLDFGGGLGYFSQAARVAGYQSSTYDPFISNESVKKGGWDTVVALHVLEHANDLDGICRQIKELLTPTGRLILAVPNFSSRGYHELGMRWVWAQPPLIHVFHFTAAGLSSLLTRHGFKDIEVTFHERWDANLYCDVEHASYFRKWDSAWGLRPLKAFPFYRRMIAKLNSRRRFHGLEQSLFNFDPTSNIYSELQVTAVLGE